ncbi:MAG: thiol reductase thioredoxin [Kofleriaceae bacterium]|nr:thiol reductase thioredoxin [Myxococcales bacterium]MCB9572151.1 thiol reductase thioredoxin [Kofleriaceae bacterium]
MLRTCPSCGADNRIPMRHLADRGRCGRCKHDLPPLATPVDVPDDRTFDEIVGAARVPVLVDFWATWCGPCRMVAPEVKRAAELMAGRAVVLKVDTDRLPSLAARYGIRGIPGFVVLRDGRVVLQEAGAVRHTELMRWVDQARVAA